MTVSSGELESHFLHELERLYKLSGSTTVAKPRLHETLRPPAHPGDSGPDGRWEVSVRTQKTNLYFYYYFYEKFHCKHNK